MGVCKRDEPEPCPKCGYLLDAASGLDHEESPTAGDFTLCLSCAAILVFDAELHVVLASVAALEALDADTFMQLMRVRQCVIRVQEKRDEPAMESRE
jgi:hypothetical protein